MMGSETVIDGMPPLSEDTVAEYLAPWVDGALNNALAARVEGFVAQSDEYGRMAEAMRTLNDMLPDAFSTEMMAPIPPLLVKCVSEVGLINPTVAPREQIRLDEARPIIADWRPKAGIRVFAAASIVAVAALSIGLGYEFTRETPPPSAQLIDTAPPHWITEIADQHLVHAADVERLVEIGAERTSEIESWLGERTGRTFGIPDLKGAGLDFAGARLLTVDGQPTAHLVYEGDAFEGPVAFSFVRRIGEDQPLKSHMHDGLRMISWHSDDFGYVVTAADENKGLESVAELGAERMQ